LAPAIPASVMPETVGQPTSLVEAQHMELEAISAINSGNFSRTRDLLGRVNSFSHDSTVEQMLGWIDGFQSQLDGVTQERHKEFTQMAGDAHKLLAHKMDAFAVEEVESAYVLAEDKQAFRSEPWVADLLKEAGTLAAQAEESQQWVAALRLYSALIIVEPTNTQWNAKHKAVFRRARLLSEYAPDRYQQLLDAEVKQAEAAAAILRPATRPAKSALLLPTTQPADMAAQDNFRVDWHELTHGIEFDTLWDALVLADKQYYRDVDYQTLLQGGLMGIRSVATTDGLDGTFPGLRDLTQRKKFVDAVDACAIDARAATSDTAEDVLYSALHQLQQVNHETVKLPDQVLIREFADGAFSKLDPFSEMTWPYDMEELEKTTRGEFGGVGIRIELDEMGQLKVVTPLPNTPARGAGVRAGGTITGINGRSAKGVSVEEAVKAITGAPGSFVMLTIKDADGTERDYHLRREIIKIDSVEGFCPSRTGRGIGLSIRARRSRISG
jgi:hypothetical protein